MAGSLRIPQKEGGRNKKKVSTDLNVLDKATSSGRCESVFAFGYMDGKNEKTEKLEKRQLCWKAREKEVRKKSGKSAKRGDRNIHGGGPS